MGVKKVKVKINANDFEIFETQAVMPLNVEEKYGSFKKFKKEYKKWTEAKQNAGPLLERVPRVPVDPLRFSNGRRAPVPTRVMYY